MLRRILLCVGLVFVTAVSLPAQLHRPTPFVPPGSTGNRNSNHPADMVTMQYPNSDVLDVLHLYENLTGKKLVMDNNVQGKVNIFLAKPVPRDEAIRIIEMNLALNGYSLVPAEGDIVEVIGINKNPRAAAVPIISDPADLPDGAQVVSYLFRLDYADPQELQQVLSQYLAGIGGQAPILALPKSSSLLITQSADVLRKMVTMVQQLDVAPAQVTSKFFKLERADAQKVVDMLKDIFEKNDQTPQTGGIRRVRGIIPPAQQGGEEESAVLSEESLVVGKIKLEADVRTNRIHVITRPINLPFIEKLISEFDANVEFGKPVVRPLKYIAAGDVLPVLVQALTEPGEENQQGQGLNPQQQQGRNPRSNPSPSPSNTNLSGTASDSTLQVNEELSTEPVNTAPQAVTVGNTKLIADSRANSIIVLGNREVVVKVTKILDEMDVKAPQVALSTVIGELSLTNNEEFGVDYFLQFKKNNLGGGAAPIGVGGAGSFTGAPILDPASLITFPTFASLPTGQATAYVAAGNTLAAIVKALDSTGRFRTVSRPTVFTSNNKKAIIASGTEVPVPTNTISSSTGGGIINTGLAQQTNIEFKKVALQLEVVPLINSEKEVSLDILQKVDSIAGTTTIDGNAIPNISTRYIRTTVSAPNRSTIVLGGLIQDENRRNRTGFPILDRIPLIGGLFADTLKTKTRTELIVLMRPEVMLSKLELYRARGKQEGKTHFGPELDEDDCPDCPPISDGKSLPPPDLPIDK
ncbi:MAG TPA: secretin N-terminal domain-containing protein [Chthoniobacterales bacterium]